MCTGAEIGLLIAAVGSAGASVYSSMQTPDVAEQPQIKGETTLDKSVAQEAEQLDEALIGDEDSERRRKKSAKEKFKVPQLETGVESGVQIQSATGTSSTGVQI